MLVERGHVQKARAGRVVVSIKRSSSCSSCAARGACMVFGPTERHIEVLDPVGAAPGDEVEIGLPPGRVVWASTIAYVLPVVAMLVGGVLGAWLAPPESTDAVAAGSAFLCLALAGGGDLASWACRRAGRGSHAGSHSRRWRPPGCR